MKITLLSGARCAGDSPRDDIFFPDPRQRPGRADQLGPALAKAREFCDGCPVRVQCREAGERSGSQGIWGGEYLKGSHEPDFNIESLRNRYRVPTPAPAPGWDTLEHPLDRPRADTSTYARRAA